MTVSGVVSVTCVSTSSVGKQYLPRLSVGTNVLVATKGQVDRTIERKQKRPEICLNPDKEDAGVRTQHGWTLTEVYSRPQ